MTKTILTTGVSTGLGRWLTEYAVWEDVTRSTDFSDSKQGNA